MELRNIAANFYNADPMHGVHQPQQQGEPGQAALWHKFASAFEGEAEAEVVRLLSDIQSLRAPPGGRDGGPDVIDQFRELARHARNETRLTVEVSPSGKVGLLINQDQIARLTLSPEQVNMLLHLNGVLNEGPCKFDVSPLKRHEIPVLLDGLANANFERGGKYKNFYSGVLCAKTKVAGEFNKEKTVKTLADRQAVLQRYVSTQQQLDHPPPGLRADRVYATVPMYQPDEVRSCELDTLLAQQELSADQSRGLALQFTDMLKQFYLVGLKHGDLHMHNLMVREVRGEPGCADQTLLQAIDFGKSAHERSRKDVHYAFERKAEHRLETFNRNVLRRDDDPAQQKHYPLHKLLGQWAGDRLPNSEARERYIAQPLARIGRSLDQNLKAAGCNRNLIDQAFDEARRAVNQLSIDISPVKQRLPIMIEMCRLN